MKPLIMIVTVIVIVAIGNFEMVPVRFLDLTFNSPLILLMLIPLLVGLLSGWLVSPITFLKDRLRNTANHEKMVDIETKMKHWDQLRDTSGVTNLNDLAVERHPNYRKYEALRTAVMATTIIDKIVKLTK